MAGRVKEILSELADLYERKNKDYAEGGVQGEHGNFERVAQLMSMYPTMNWATPNGVALVYSFKQLDAALSLLSQNKASVTGEPVEARLRDVAVYSVIGIALAEDPHLTVLRDLEKSQDCEEEARWGNRLSAQSAQNQPSVNEPPSVALRDLDGYYALKI